VNRLSFLSWPLSLSAQLILTFVALVAATVAMLTIAADASAVSSLKAQAVVATSAAAQTRNELLSQLLTLRQVRAAGLLSSASELCGEPDQRGGLSFSDQCVDRLILDFSTPEDVTGVVLTYRGRPRFPKKVPPNVESIPPEDGTAIAWITNNENQIRFLTQARASRELLAVEYDDRAIRSIFEGGSGVANQGETFLVDEQGRALTALRQPATTESLKAVFERCSRVPAGDAGDDERDYRGRRVVAAYQLSYDLAGTCVVAYTDYEEALAPVAEMRRELIARGAGFVIAGALLSLFAARRIAAPVKRLAVAARALQSGDFSKQVPISGPREVQDLGRALAAMASDLSDLVSQEQFGRREAEAANRSKDQFLAMLSHELRTPLNSVIGWAHTLRAHAGDPARVERAAAAIERGAESQRRLIEDLLDVTGIAAGRVRMDLAPTRLCDVVEAAVDAVAPRAADKDVRLDDTIEDSTLVVHGDAQRLQQVVWNLLWNAVKFTPAGGRVSVRLRAVGALAEITVSDTGIGIEPKFLPQVFGWFRREDRESRSPEEGLGLGLALVRQLVELHGGAVRAESEGKDRGSRFVVTLPLASAEGVRTESGTPLTQPAGESLAAVRVLVVDDDPGSREAVRVLLEQVGASVMTVASAAEARRELRASGADVIISDIAMEQESGYTLMESLRAEGLTIPGIALTGYARREDADRAYAAGFDVHLPKPVDPSVLVSVLGAVTRRGV
jgi:signal transduction histidine kinase